MLLDHVHIITTAWYITRALSCFLLHSNTLSGEVCNPRTEYILTRYINTVLRFQFSDTLLQCLQSASNVIKCVIDNLGPSGYFRYAPDGHFVFAAFASAFLLKVSPALFIVNFNILRFHVASSPGTCTPHISRGSNAYLWFDRTAYPSLELLRGSDR